MNSSDESWKVLYRGSLSSCNYACGYCPFAKTRNTREELLQDAREVDRFCDWVVSRPESIGVLFTPWGEALIRSHYRRAMVRLSHAPNVDRVAIQTNLSCSLNWVLEAERNTIAFWTTFHPGETDSETFVAKCQQLEEWGVRFSVGMVGLRENRASAERLRGQLAESTYLWINAYKREPEYYSGEDRAFWRSIDPYFDLNNRYHPSRGKACSAGQTSFTVDGCGDVRRCHFIPEVIGNIYDEGFLSGLRKRRCSNETCGCHIGYVHLKSLGLNRLFGPGLLERIPERWPAVDEKFRFGSVAHTGECDERISRIL